MEGRLKPYQSQAFAKYVDIARLFGWDVLERFWSEMNQDYEVPAKELVRLKNDELILQLSKAAGAELTPLLTFWGAHPENPDQLKRDVSRLGFPRSAKVYDTLEHYKTLPPPDNVTFRQFASQWWVEAPMDASSHLQSKNEHFEQLTAYNEESAETIRKEVQNIMNEYFPFGRPKGE